MGSLQNDETDTAIHELGHGMVACVLDLPVSDIEIWQNEKIGWAGKCHLIPMDSLLPEAAIDTFNMGGALLQLLMVPNSVGKYVALFDPSLFSGSRQLIEDDTPLQELFWASDFWKSRFHVHADDILSGRSSEKPHLLDLEKRLRTFLGDSAVQALVTRLAKRLATEKRLTAAELKREFYETVPAEKYSDLRKFVLSIPERIF